MSLHKTIIVASVFALGFGGGVWHAAAHGKKHNPVRHQFIMKNGIPAAYQSLANPLTPNPDDLAKGATLYADNCASCHEPTGNGDGADAGNLNPRPPALRGMMKMMSNMRHGPGMMKHGPGMMGQGRQTSMMTEGYLYWTVSEGGEALGMAMRGFKDALSAKARWQLILFMSNDFKAN